MGIKWGKSVSIQFLQNQRLVTQTCRKWGKWGCFLPFPIPLFPAMRLLFAFLLPLTLSVVSAPAAEKLNVLFLMADDMRPEVGCYGNAQVKTPNIDGLAKAGVKFDRAFVQYPLCNPSRASMLTGRYPTSTGVLDNLTWWGTAHPDWKSLPAWFKEHGYASLRCGKIFHGGIDDTDAWTEGGEKRKFDGATNTAHKGQDKSHSDQIVVLDDAGEARHIDTKTRLTAIEYLERYQDKPFFLACGFTKPHSPPTAPKRFFDMYDPKAIPLPKDFAPRPAAPPGFPAISIPARNSDLFIERDASPEAAQEMIRAYHASLTWVDWNVGEVLAALDRLHLRDKTIVLFWGDHGYHLGEKGKWSKHNSLFDTGTRVPLIISAPGMSGNGKVSPRVVECLGIYPTLVELCGLPAPSGLQGESLAPLLKDPAAPWNRAAVSVTKLNGGVIGKTVRTEKWRYAEWGAGGEEGSMLIDEENDPVEMTNLVSDPKRASEVKALKAPLERLK
jgi:arylsulfatase A-like enzyme